MGYNVKYLPNLQDLMIEYKELGHQTFLQRIKKYESFVGPIESQKFINRIINKKTK